VRTCVCVALHYVCICICVGVHEYVCELVKARSYHGAKQHWRNVVNADLKPLNTPLHIVGMI